MRILVTGAAGFIGFHLSRRLIADGHLVVGFDGMTPYYDVALKAARRDILACSNGFRMHEAMLEDTAALAAAAEDCRPDVIVHLAAQAGVRYSLENPHAYVESNLTGTFNVLEVAREHQPAHLLVASTSSVYGGNTQMPFRETDTTDAPMTLYAATKRSGEAMSHSYAHLWGLPTTCFRFFTVYGPWGRPDMALFKFVDAMEKGQPIPVYGEGRMSRDFTYIDDLVESIVRLIARAPERDKPIELAKGRDSLSPVAPWRVVNIAGGQPVGLMDFIEAIEAATGISAEREMLPMQKGDVEATFADPELLEALTGYLPSTPVPEGVSAFVEWYRQWRRTAL
ncbi:NAD-dependent epimerase/dehydratase family protein [Pelagibacterium montanilacus]|uniref:NAD-dependent epimerase/dehydratase family protein n=1 Tax=Pelagibacterium montanilacus TaxID=2185280 RepID=UPI000F8DDB00|nr:NAD-dependent epimerase/dehydratase family protein [Pelagibacterium montanilacus]